MKYKMLILLCFIHPALAYAVNQPVENASEIVGCWERVDFSEQAKKTLNEIEPRPIRYQWFCFEPDGTLYSANSSTYEKQTSKSLREAFKSLPKDITYTLVEKGILKTEQKSAKQTIIWGAKFMGGSPVSFDGKVFDKDTFIMTLISKEKQQVVYYRYLKRIE